MQARTEVPSLVGLIIQATIRRQQICLAMPAYQVTYLRECEARQMNEAQRNACNHIRMLDSERAADWLIERYSIGNPNSGEVFKVMPHRSWEKRDQIKLADYFLKDLPHRSGKGYEAFLSFMSIPAFIGVLRRNVPLAQNDKDLLTYYIGPILRSHDHYRKYETDIEIFLTSLSSSL